MKVLRMQGFMRKLCGRPVERSDPYGQAWRLGTIVCFLLYFSGVYGIHRLFEEHIRRRQRRVVLTYHRVRDDSLDSHISVTPKTFDRQLRYLTQRFTLTSVNALLAPPDQVENGRKSFVALTFDDGYLDNFEQAFPLLKKYAVPATIFLVSRWLGKTMFMSRHHIMEMLEHGIEFGSHTLTHPVLSSINSDQAKDEIEGSKKDLERMLRRAVRFFAYPKGKHQDVNPDIIRGVAAAGYEAAFMAENGAIRGDESPYELKRIGIRECPMIVFKLRLSGLLETKPFFLIRQAFGLT
ncbi:MAG: polysaccharide deacetylase family protein [Deltaproteobacteria bacterium]|nr:polysaccharide deacetylase family protein [Deltaproteobacteria bacterium]